MTLEEAYRLLRVESGDTEREVRARYHRAMRHCHPDAGNLEPEEALEKTRQLNAAFSRILRSLRESGKDRIRFVTPGGGSKKGAARTPAYTAPENPAAFCARTVYRTDISFGGMEWEDPEEEDVRPHRPYPVATGKFLWDPDEESFPMFLYSLHQTCRALSGTDDINPMLLHLLALEFIRPWASLRSLSAASPVIRRVPGEPGAQETYLLEGYIHPDRTGRRQLEEALSRDEGATLPLSPGILRERIHLFYTRGAHVPDTDLGYISFAEDALYYICLMIVPHAALFAASA